MSKIDTRKLLTLVNGGKTNGFTVNVLKFTKSCQQTRFIVEGVLRLVVSNWQSETQGSRFESHC